MNNAIFAITAIDMGLGEVLLCSAYFGPQLYGDTLTGTPTVVQKSGDAVIGLGSASINTGGAVVVDGISRAVSTCVQFTATVPSNAVIGENILTVTAETTDGNTRKMYCTIRVW